MQILDALRAIQEHDPDAILTKVMMWKVGDLIEAIESGNSDYGFTWSFEGDDYIPRTTTGLGCHVNRPHPDGGENIIFSTPSAKQLGIIGGQKRTEAKKRAAIENGKKGGRPHYFVQVFNALPAAIQQSEKLQPIEILPGDSAAAFSLQNGNITWQIRWDSINRQVIAFQNGLVTGMYPTISTAPQSVATQLIEAMSALSDSY